MLLLWLASTIKHYKKDFYRQITYSKTVQSHIPAELFFMFLLAFVCKSKEYTWHLPLCTSQHKSVHTHSRTHIFLSIFIKQELDIEVRTQTLSMTEPWFAEVTWWKAHSENTYTPRNYLSTTDMVNLIEFAHWFIGS